jgi:hypothetical protein
MANKKFWLVMLVMILAFGMMVVGCAPEETKETAIFFSVSITVKDIPSELNGQNFTMSIIRDGIVKTSETGVVADGRAAVKRLKIKNMAPKSEITLDVFGKEVWTADIAIKIGNNPQRVKTEEFRKFPDGTDAEALINGSVVGLPYSDFK